MTEKIIKKAFQRLPTNVVPVNYKLKIAPNFDTFTFTGEEEIEINVKESTKKIQMNSLNLQVTEACFHQGQSCLAASVIEEKQDEIINFLFQRALPVGLAKFSLKFSGILSDNMKGLYRSKYTDTTGKVHHIASTQFEPTDARRSFPCWDEPAIKATFDITIVGPKNTTVLSNTNVIKKVEGEVCDTYTFARTPIMSTYLIAYVIGDFDHITREIEGGLKVSVYTPVGKSKMGEYALEAACKTVPFYTKYFDVPYPLPKLDLIAIPDFAAGAMENWGLITYREMALLVDEKSSASATQYVAIVVGHEIAHQWFGNLVTMEWWTHLWLNEGFASWVEYLSVDHCFPKYKIWKQFLASEYARALELDGLKNSHPIEVEVGHPSEITEIFDAISYSKGAAVIRMLNDYIGPERFAAGLSSYLKKFSYKNALTADLWESLSESSKKPVGKIMSSWTSQMGYPIITVSKKEVKGGVDLTLSQERFISDGSKSEVSMKWIVPLSIVSSENPDKPVSFLLEKESDTVHIPLKHSLKWIKLNAGQVGFYRVKYSDDMFSSLLSALQTFKAEERLGFLNDAFALARSGRMKTTGFLELMVALSEEKDNLVWEELSGSILSVVNILAYSKHADENVKNIYKVINKLLQNVYAFVGLDKESSKAPEQTHHILLLRSIVVGMMVKTGDVELGKKLRFLCDQHTSGKISVAPDIRSAMFASVLSSNQDEDFYKLVEYYKASTETEEKVRILKALSAISKPELVKRSLDFSISEFVRPQDTLIGLSAIASNSNSRGLAWEFVKEKWSFLWNRYEGGYIIFRILKETIQGFATKSMQTDIKEFFAKNPSDGVVRSLHQGLESISINQRWLERDEESIITWLSKQ